MADVNWAQLLHESLDGANARILPPSIQLPALPLAVTRFLELSSQPEVHLRELATVLETDAALTLELLRHVNSAYLGLRQKARTVQTALSLLGLRQSKLFIIATGTQAALRARQSKLVNPTTFWNSSLQRSLFAREIARMLKSDPDVAFAGALLQDYLLPVLADEFLDVYLDFTARRDQHPDSLVEYERQRLGCDHAQVAAAMAHHWQLPEDLSCCILFHHHGLRVLADPCLARTPVAAVALSALLPDPLQQSRSGLEQLALLETKWPAFQFERLINTVDTHQAELGLGVGNDFPLTRRCRQFLEQRRAAV